MKWNLMEDAISFSDRVKMAKFVMSTNKFTNGEKVKEVEKQWNEWLGSKNSLFVSSGSTANFLLLSSIIEKYQLKKGSKILVPACTWMTNVAPIIQLGMKPIFCDIQIEDFSFSYPQLGYIAEKHPDIKAIFVTHLLGFSSLSRTSGLLDNLFPEAVIIDDVCESHGCKYDHQTKVGANSLGATFSTYFGHHLTSIEGGFVSTYDDELFDLMKMKRSHGMARESVNFEAYKNMYPEIDPSFLFITDGYNFRNTEINAVLCSSQLNKLDKSIEIRNRNFKLFCSIIKDFKHKVEPIFYSETSSNFCFPLICKTEELKGKLQQRFKQNNIEYRPIVSGNLLRHPFLEGYKVTSDTKSLFVEEVHKKGLYIGNNQFIGRKHLEKLYDVLERL